MPQNAPENRPFRWNRASIEAAFDVAEGTLTEEQIAQKVGADRKTLFRWRGHPDFAARVEEHREAIRQAVFSRGIARPENRIARQNARWEALHRVLEARGKAMEGECPGGETGLIVGEIKLVKVFELPRGLKKALAAGEITPGDLQDEDFQPTRQVLPMLEYRVDTATLASILAHEKQAAQEMGQWVERQKIDVNDLTPDQLVALLSGGQAPDTDPETTH